MDSFEERQKFTQWWLWAILFACFLIPTGIVAVDYYKNPTKYNIADVLSGASVFIAILILIKSCRLDTEVNFTGISYRFFPFQFRKKQIDWADVKKVNVRQYNPILDYGGWGIRFGMKGRGMAYNVAGNMGIQLELKADKKILIGTQKPEEVSKLIQQLAKQKIVSVEAIVWGL